jgi:signal peptidase II
VQERGTVTALSRRGARPRAGAPTAPRLAAGPRGLRIGLASAAVVVAADQVTKSLAISRLTSGPVHVIGPFGFALGYNSGAAFSLFTKATPVLGTVAAILALVLSWLAWRARSAGVAVAAGVVLGGALGNLCDRVFRAHHGAVVDFITLTHWPTFNVADACVTLGTLALVVLQLRHGLVAPSARRREQ